MGWLFVMWLRGIMWCWLCGFWVKFVLCVIWLWLEDFGERFGLLGLGDFGWMFLGDI